MANLNLSEFTEKLFVADADHTFIWDTANAISKRVSRNSWLNSGTLTSDAPVTISQTWNNAAVAFTGLKVNAAGTSDANSASGSLLLDLQLGGVSKIYARKDGTLIAPTQIIAGTTSNAGQTAGLVANGIYLAGGTIYGPSTQFIIAPGTGISQNSVSYIAWGSGVSGVGTVDTILLRDGAANTLALRNGAGVPQTFRVYNTFLGTTANEWFEIDWKVSAGTVRLFTMHGGTGVARNMDISAGATLFFGAGSGSPIRMYSGNVERWNISATGHFIAAADNTYDIGASGANRPRNVYVGNNVIVGNTVSTGICDVTAIRLAANGSGCVIRQDSNGIIRLSNNNETDFTRLQFGGATDAAPAIARDGAGIKFTGAAAGSTAWIKVPPVAVSALPLAATSGAGARAFVNDALAPTFGSAVTGGGAVLVPVYSDGSAWNVG